jgi:maltose/moltooligosaccharide transporter
MRGQLRTVIAPASTPVLYLTCALIGLGGLFAGVTGPLVSAFVPPLVRDALGDHRTAIGIVMAIDNVLLLLLVPWAGALSDRASATGRGRLPIVLAGFVLAAAGMALFASSLVGGLTGLILSIVVLYTGINIQRSPIQALIADLLPSRYRSLASSSVMFQMCLGAIVFLMLGRMLGRQTSFLIASGTILGIAALIASGIREQKGSSSHAADASFASVLDAVTSILRGTSPGMRATFVASLLMQMTFQSFTTWYSLHGTERFGVRPEDVTAGFIAWAMGGVIGALPAGMIGVRLGRRNTMMLGFALMAGSLLALDRVTSMAMATPLLALASASWTLPMVNAYPLFVEPVPRHKRGVLAALFLLSMALGGGIGDPVNGSIFDWSASYRPLFLMMTAYTALAFVAVLFVPRGAGEAGTGPDDTAEEPSAMPGR